ncbi:shikimate dehydrogenase family protein [Pedobacter chitinilyticus]|uniref:Shikimate dehydrogenase n=2 Tax=Pedobacter chitinilyticus TaxID=2233776 RepID=A0A3S3R5K1_9SPHI|nr:shikimate dehydrogenase [Pedobacter chitinilyticus]RWU06307.1 shikimate dehydrogenase [Pedobacter chitinilyticus]
MRTFGLIGFPLSASFSKQFFADKFKTEGIKDCKYELHPVPQAKDMLDLIEADPLLCGLNVTIPHKVSVMPFMTELDDAAEKIGAVNCISIDQSGDKPRLKGYNTDVYGFEESLKPLLKAHHKKALIFGDGGAAMAVKYVFNKLQIPFISVVRNAHPNAVLYSSVTKDVLEEYTILVNTTPLGMFPNIDSFPPIPYQHLSEQHLAYDLVYNPEETQFLAKAKAQGAAIKNGLEMLHLQAERSWDIWNAEI